MAKKTSLEEIGKMVTFLVENVAMKEDITELNRRVGSLEKGQVEILDKLEPISRAVDKDAVTIIDHGKRISRIEKQLAVR